MSYEESVEHILDEINRIDLMLTLQVLKFSEDYKISGNEFQGIVITPKEISTLLKQENKKNQEDNSVEEELKKQIIKKEATISEKVSSIINQGRNLSLYHISRLFQLTNFEKELILICLATEINKKYEKIYGYLNDDLTKKNPSINMAIELLCSDKDEKLKARKFFAETSTLFKYGILYFISEDQSEGSCLNKSFKLDSIVVEFLLQSQTYNHTVNSFSKIWMFSL